MSSRDVKSTKDVELRAFDDEIRDLEFDRGKPDEVKEYATAHDLRDMDALGLTPTFRRRFKFVAMVGFSSTVVVGWQNMMATFSFALYNGGTGGLFWTFIFSMIALTFVYLTLAELSSSFPTAGGQYQWVAECAPPSMRRVLSYCTGWLCVLAWATFLASCGVIVGNTTKACILIYHPDSTAINSQWFPTVFAMGLLGFGGFFNLYLTNKIPIFESIMLMIHLASWAAIIVTLWTTSPRSEANDVLFTFSNGGLWPNAGIATLIGVLTPWSSMVGYDSSVHMTENAKDASKTIPYALMVAYVFNAGLAFIAAVTLIFCAGDLNDILSNPSIPPYIMIFLNSTGSRAGTVLMVVPIILCFTSALISEVATASRQLWAFARDGGMPFSTNLEPVYDAEVPRRAVWTTIVFTWILACINFSPAGVGFNAIISLVIVSLTSSYTVTIACVIWRRYFGKPIPKERFSLGKFGGIINIIALCCVAPVTVLAVFPSDSQPTLAYMNWAIVMFGAVLISAAVYYVIVGRRRFDPPIRKEEYL